jgi:two-component system response regulator DevR
MQRETPYRVMIVDDHEVVRMGLRTLLDASPEVEVVGEAATGREAERLAEATRPDVIIMDVRLPDESGVEACRNIRAAHPEMRVIMLTSYGDDEALFSSLAAGASGYVLKETRGRTLVEAVLTVANGGSLFDPNVADKVLERLRSRPPEPEADPLAELTPQERRILQLIARGMTNKEIAGEVFLSEKTVKHYVSNILSKLGLSRRSEAAAYIARLERT